jgi:hypothetical protein
MKRTLITLAGIFTSITCCYLLWFSTEPVASSERVTMTSAPIAPHKITQSRLSIAFILGEDKEADNPYYAEAMRYYTTHAEGKTDFIITTCRSLTEVKDYLKKNALCNDNPWGKIHLVSHGNQWTGLSVKVTPDSKRATVDRIVEYTQSGMFELLDHTVVDSQTTIFLHGCGVGNNRDLVNAVRKFFSGKNEQPIIFAPKLFEYYASSGSEKNLQSQHYLAQSWFVNYPMGDKPSSGSLTSELREKYNDARVDWQSALSHEQPRWIGDAYHYTFEVPVKWIIAVDSVPDLTEENQNVWLHDQQQIVDELKALQIPVEKFKWSFSSGYTETKSGGKSRAVFVKGYCTMLCVLQVLTDGQNEHLALQKPFAPALTDTRFYYSTGQKALAGI